MTKQLFLNVILYVTITIVLIYQSIDYWKRGVKGVAFLNMFVAALTLWQAIENAKDLKEIKTS